MSLDVKMRRSNRDYERKDKEEAMKDNEYQCAKCGKVYEKGVPDEEAWAEHDLNFPGEPHETAAIICDDCYRSMVAIRPPPGMQPEEWIRLCFTKSWWWRVLHPIQSKKIRGWISEFEAFLNTDEQREKFENEVASVITDLLLYGEAKLPDQKTYGRSPLAAAMKDIAVMNEVKKFNMKEKP